MELFTLGCCFGGVVVAVVALIIFALHLKEFSDALGRHL